MKTMYPDHRSKLLAAVISFHGLFIMVLALAAYPLGHSSSPGIGPTKLLGAVVGAALVVVGLTVPALSGKARPVIGWLGDLWRSYWFRPGGRYGLAIARIAVASAVLLSFSGHLQTDYGALLRIQNPVLYRPIGVLALLGQSVPPDTFFETAKVAALVSTWLVLFGLLTRVSMAVSTISILMLSSLEYSFSPEWCHEHNVIHLAQIALLFGPSGDCLSLDALVRSWLKKSRASDGTLPPNRYQWPVILAQWAVALMFANAAWYKVATHGYHLGWALSDNLRHQLVIQYYGLGRDPSPLQEWIMTSEWRYKGAALGNLLCQSLPLLACVFINRPILRALFGLAFVLEVLGLGLVMEYWVLYWLPLYAVFIDWDRLLNWADDRLPQLRERLVTGDVTGLPLSAHTAQDRGILGGRRTSSIALRYEVAASLFIILFLDYYVATAVRCPRAENRTTYPFGAYPMYSSIAAKRPLNEHQSYEIPWIRIESPNTPPPDDSLVSFHSLYQYLCNVEDIDINEEKACLQTIKKSLGVDWIILKKIVLQVPPYPTHPKPVTIHEGLMSSLDEDGKFVAVTVVNKWDSEANQFYLEVRSAGYVNPTFRFGYILNNLEGPKPLTVSRRENRFYYDRSEDGRYRWVIYVSDPSLGPGEHLYLR